MPGKILMVELRHTARRQSPTNNSTPCPSQKVSHGMSTANPRMMDQFPCVYTGTLTYSTVPNRLRISPSQARLSPFRLLSHHIVIATFAKILFSPGSLHNDPVMRVVYTSLFSRATTTTTPLSLGFMPFNVGTKPTVSQHTRHLKHPHTLINTTAQNNSNRTCSP